MSSKLTIQLQNAKFVSCPCGAQFGNAHKNQTQQHINRSRKETRDQHDGTSVSLGTLCDLNLYLLPVNFEGFPSPGITPGEARARRGFQNGRIRHRALPFWNPRRARASPLTEHYTTFSVREMNKVSRT
jgi:hypothetical protein